MHELKVQEGGKGGMEKQADSGFSSANSGESSTRNDEDNDSTGGCCREKEEEEEEEEKTMLLEVDEKDREWDKEKLCNDILKLPYEFFYKQDNEGDTWLHATVTLGLPEASCWLIELAPQAWLLDIANDESLTALHLAVMTRQARVVRRLVLAGANRLLRTATGNTALHLACTANDLDCAKALAEPLTAQERYCLTAAGRHAPSMLNQQLTEIRNYNGKTCLHIAAAQGHLELVRQLLSTGAEVNAREGLRGMTSLHLALERGHTSVARLLARERPYCIDVVNYAGLTTYEIAMGLDRRLADELVRLRCGGGGGGGGGGVVDKRRNDKKKRRKKKKKKQIEEIDVDAELAAFARMSVMPVGV